MIAKPLDLSRIKRALPGVIFVFIMTLLMGSAPARLFAQQTTADYDAERRRAFALIRSGNLTEALPLFEKLSAARPEDGEVMFYLGFALFGKVKTLKDAGARRQMRFRARAAMLRAKELGVNTPLLNSILESLPADGGGDDIYSENKEADAAMRDGEAVFTQGKLDEAIAHYQRALQLDPKLYTAALYVGDMYFKKGEPDKAAEWFTRAIQIDPDRETAYRYSASPLMEQGKYTQAKAKYIEAVIAEPYNRLTWAGLARWAEATKTQLSHPRIDIPTGVTPLKDNKMTINVSPDALGKDDGTAAWMAYGIGRAGWAMGKFAKEFPDEKAYRHSLREEAEALALVVSSVKTQTKENKIKTLDPALARLVKLHDEGLLEAYILFARSDQGIARDYEKYRQANRDKLRRYLIEYVTSGRQ
ncbi:MAG: tetratricopeptide repeat protein [Pyrinomonadaceae bacterium]|nr:tetratricopeptide repeat protein [Pyrinomonadaceae bacterium]